MRLPRWNLWQRVYSHIEANRQPANQPSVEPISQLAIDGSSEKLRRITDGAVAQMNDRGMRKKTEIIEKHITYASLCNMSACECERGIDWSLSVDSSRGRSASNWPVGDTGDRSNFKLSDNFLTRIITLLPRSSSCSWWETTSKMIIIIDNRKKYGRQRITGKKFRINKSKKKKHGFDL